MNRKSTFVLLSTMLLIVGMASAQYDLEMDVEFPHATNVIMTNLEGTGDLFTVKARVTYNGDPVNYPETLELDWYDFNSYFVPCDYNIPALQPTSGPDSDGWYFWDDIRLPAGGVWPNAENPYAYNVLQIVARDSWWVEVMGDIAVGNIIVSSPDICGLDGVVNLSDITTFQSYVGGPYYVPGADLNGDGLVNLSDIVRFTAAIGTTCSGKNVTVDKSSLEKAAVEQKAFDSLKSMYR